MSDDLKPCPFCGDKTPYTDEASCRVFGNRTGHNFAVACSNCEVSAPGNRTMEGAIAEWNTRTPDPRIEALTEERDEARAGNHSGNEHEPTWRELTEYWKQRAEAVEAKLAKAVERLTNMRDDQTGYRHVSHFRRGAAVTLAEIEGEKG